MSDLAPLEEAIFQMNLARQHAIEGERRAYWDFIVETAIEDGATMDDATRDADAALSERDKRFNYVPDVLTDELRRKFGSG